MIEIVCIGCGADDHLHGRAADDGMIELSCTGCGITWLRNPNPHCERCGGDDMEAAPKVLLEKSRGTQMSIQGIQREFLCRNCDADRIAQRRAGHLPGRLGEHGAEPAGPSIDQLAPGWNSETESDQG